MILALFLDGTLVALTLWWLIRREFRQRGLPIQGSIEFRFDPISGNERRRDEMQEYECPDTQRAVKVEMLPKNAAGRPARVDTEHGVPDWSIADAGIATLEPTADGMACTVVLTGVAGETPVHVNADADLGEGVVGISGTFLLRVTQSQAVDLGFGFSDPDAK